jgi:HD-like signal output (HDOD) protein/CheY-like chemotaxis protein
MSKKSILFVDDNENVINGIQRQLRSFRQQWQLFFANSGQQALDLMSKQTIDLVITDMMMPRMDGAELLKEINRLYPNTVRMILSGYADESALKTAMEVAHQYLSKPCSAEVLREVISQVFKIQSCISNPSLVAGIGDLHQLPSLPKIYHELNKAMKDENVTVNELADIFSRDMVLSAKLLHLINSPYFGMNRVISNITEAINLIGVKKLNNLVLSAHVKTAFPVTNPQLAGYFEYIWEDAGRVSELAKQIAIAENQFDDRPDQAFLGGLLHNMGLLIFLSKNEDKLRSLLTEVKTSKKSISELEKTIFGYTRSEAAAYVLSLWKIPPRIIEAILLQNAPNESDYEGVNALTAVHAAACLLSPENPTEYQKLFKMELDTAYLQRLGLLEKVPVWQTLAERTQFQKTTK